MTALEHEAVLCLSRCSFPPGSSDKRLARQWRERLEEGLELSDRGQAYLWVLAHRYRRQIASAAVRAEAERRLRGEQEMVEQLRLEGIA